MAQRFILNGTSYHGAGAIKEIATEAIARYKEHVRKWQQENEMKQNNTSKKSIEI